MPQEPKLQMLPDSSMKLSGSIFRKIVRRIESIVPIAGDRIAVTPKDSGYEIRAIVPVPIAGDNITIVETDNNYEISSTLPSLNVITLNVCSNGSPDTISVFGPFYLEAFGV